MIPAKNVSLFLALRYLRPKRSFVSVITVMSILGVSFGVAALIVVISVMAGFERKIKETLLGSEPHIEIGAYTPPRPQALDGSDVEMPEPEPPGADWFQAMEATTSLEGVESVFPYVEGLIFLDAGDNPNAAGVRAIREEDQGQAQRLFGEIGEGAFNLSDADLPDECDGRIVLGPQIAMQLNVYAGDLITAYAPNNVGQIVRALREMEDKPEEERGDLMDEVESMILPYQLEVSGILRGDNVQTERLALLPLHIAQEIFETRGAVHGLSVLTTDPYRAGEMKAQLEEILPPGWYPQTWMEKHKTFFDSIRTERAMMFYVLSIIVVVAAFCTMNTMITVTVQKRREIGVITALGSKVSHVMWIFLGQGMVVGLLGAVLGIGLGGIIIYLRNDIREFIARVFDREIFAQATYGLTEIPARVLWSDVALIAACAFVLCSVASLIPAYMAARTDPAKALRND